MQRKMIKIDEALCDGCGNCIIGCAEGALALVDGKAKLVKENFCDGFGDCIGTCPTGALTIEVREADEFDIEAVKENLLNTEGAEAVDKMEAAHARHEAMTHEHHHGGCPGALMRELDAPPAAQDESKSEDRPNLVSELRQWPVHFRLVPPGAPFFKNKELVMMSTCGPLAMPDIHHDYLKDRSVIVSCPKLDDTSTYVQKLSEILKEDSIPKVIISRMEVPCCGGLTMMVAEAVSSSGRTDIVIEENIIGIDGNIKNMQTL